MACEADRVSCRRRPKLFPNESTMRIVAIRTLHQSLFHAVMEGHIELRLHFHVAAVAEIRLSFGKQELIRFSLMRRMATQTAQIILAMRRSREIRMVLPRTVTFQASLIDFLRRCLLETKDLRRVPWIIHVVACGTVTCFASLSSGATLLVQGSLPMWTFLEILVNVFVAVLARVWTNISRPALRRLCVFPLLGASRTGKYDREDQKEGKLTERRNPGVPELQHSHPRSFRSRDQTTQRPSTIHSKPSGTIPDERRLARPGFLTTSATSLTVTSVTVSNYSYE